MRIAALDGKSVLVEGNLAIHLEDASAGRFADPMAVFSQWTEFLDWHRSADLPAGVAFEQSALSNPVPAPSQIFAVGANYRDHIEEAGAAVPESPLIFTKFPSCLTGPRDSIPVPSRKVDWEIELVIVIGRRAERVGQAEAWSYVAGVTAGQDISERVMQLSGDHPQFSMGKSFPGFGPIGPVVTTIDELDDPDNLELGCAIDGVVQQKSRTDNLIFSVPEIIAKLSAVCPLLPGDLIFTGTPAGVGAFRSPRRFLAPGEVLTSWVEGVGEMRNEIVMDDRYESVGGVRL